MQITNHFSQNKVCDSEISVGLIPSSIQKEYINPFSNETDASRKVTLAKEANFPKVVEINKNTLGSLNSFKVSESVEQ